MQCRQCGSALERPGDHCLVCGTGNADGVVCALGRERADITMLLGTDVVGETVVTTTAETGDAGVVARRNFVGRVADEVRRKRPETVYVAGERAVISDLRRTLRYEFFRVSADEPVAAAIEQRGEGAGLEVVETPPGEKIGGTHSTLIGGRPGRQAIEVVANHPNVKKIIPGPIDSGGSGTTSGVHAKATRADARGNVRLLVREGSSVQENRVVTTAGAAGEGERVREDLNHALSEEGLRGA